MLSRCLLQRGNLSCVSRDKRHQVLSLLHQQVLSINNNALANRYLSTVSSQDEDHKILDLPTHFLRAMDSSLWDPSTFQRNNVIYDPHNGKPMPQPPESSDCPQITSCSWDSSTNSYGIIWQDGKESNYSADWVDQQLSKWRGDAVEKSKKHLWTHLTEEKVRNDASLSLPFEEAVLTEEGRKNALKALYQYGIFLITNTPTDDGGSGVAALAAAVGGGSNKQNNPTSLLNKYPPNSPIIGLPHGTDGPLRTLYGTVWSTASSGQADGASVADSAYTNLSLPLHTDMTYQQDPPGLQIFTMVQPAVKGGESVFGDGFAVAEELRKINPQAFDVLSSVIRTYRCIDPVTGWHLEGHGPVITVRRGQVVGIRHNDLDRLPDLPPVDADEEGVQEFYDFLRMAHEAWDEVIGRDEFRLEMALQPGDTMVVANQRCFHGRRNFETTPDTPRAVIGCYMSQDELNSRFRMEGYVLP